ncbi:MAG: glycosyltransferase family 10 [Desulfuromonadales bacterium]
MPDARPIIDVKLVTRSGRGFSSPWAKQCPGNKQEWGRCRFTSLPNFRDYDWYVAVDDIPRIQPSRREVLACPQSNTILVTSEPSTVTRYGRAFARQFAYLLTNQEEPALPHPQAIRAQTGNVWFYGKSFDEIIQSPLPEKSKLMSTVCSTKQQAHTMHARRYAFTQKLKSHLPELDIFGHGVRYVENKYDALDPYRFHLVVENQIGRHLWTEKLADAFLASTVPIYCGCPNVFDYFPEESVIPIDIHDFSASLQKIRSVIYQPGEYERRLEAVLEARRRVMYEYNLPAMLDRIITTAGHHDGSVGQIIYNRQIMRLRHPPDLLRFAAWRAGNLLQKLTSYRKSAP